MPIQNYIPDRSTDKSRALTPVTFLNVRQVARIVRIVLNDGGHALLVGVGGSGKQSLSRLAAFICGYSVSQIVISSTYSINDLKEDLKTMYNKVGICETGQNVRR